MSSKLSPSTRSVILISALAMIAVLYLPVWRIELSAPQYPEGLVLQIFSDRIGGNVDVVNGLNHYIGMHALHTRDFVEFIVLPYIIGGFAALGFLVALINRRKTFFGWIILFLLIAFTSMIDFYRWEYNYGHNLDPAAPISVPGMAYQPPLLGYKQLLNFGAYSIPDIGGWIFVGVGVLLVGTALLEIRRQKQRPRAVRVSHTGPGLAITLLATTLTLQSCSTGPQPVRYGQDNCSFCKMTFTDTHFGGEVCTKKGKVYKFDDLHCLLAFLQTGVPPKENIAAIYLVDYNGGPWLEASRAVLFHSDAFHTPMGGNIAAFADRAGLQHFTGSTNSRPIAWKELYP
jgi:copper chaperone NosL